MTEQLTRGKILEMKPGRELDALVAEKVMGWEKVDASLHCIVPPFSSNISAAWEVVEKMEKTLWVRMNVMMGDHYCGIGRPDLLWECKAKSMPEAICKAALLAVMDNE